MAGVVLTQAAYEKLKRVVRQIELDHVNIKKRLERGPRKTGARSAAVQFLDGKTDAAITKGNSGTVSIYEGVTQGSETDTGENVTAYNRYGNIAINKWVKVLVFRGKTSIIAAECP